MRTALSRIDRCLTDPVSSPFDRDNPNAGLAAVFLQSAARHGDAPALIIGANSYTFAQLQETARRWATRLCQLQLDRPRRVGVCADRSLTGYLGILAAAFAGAAFVPFNPKFPVERMRTMVEKADVDAIIVDRDSLPGLQAALDGIAKPPPLLLADARRSDADWVIAFDADDLGLAPVIPQTPAVTADDVAYLLFTSGSTGAPKGVPVSNGNILSFLATNRERYRFTADDRFSQTFDHTFDLSIFDMFMAWSAGAAVCVLKQTELLSPLQFINEHSITVWFSVPSVAALLMRRGRLKPGSMPKLRWSLFCGEALPRQIAEAWQAAAPNTTLENLYGPTELTIACSVHRWHSHTSPALCAQGCVPIGNVYPGLSALVLDENLMPVAAGETGELCVGGEQTFPGYWRAPELTQERIFERHDNRGVSLRYYRTGDLVRRLANGEFAFLGRRDSQVKIKGHRIELGEIEAVLRQAGCAEAIALPWPSREAAQAVIAFITGDASPEKVKASARRKLPAYMVPRRIEPIDNLPLNVNGKADRLTLGRRAARLTLV